MTKQPGDKLLAADSRAWYSDSPENCGGLPKAQETGGAHDRRKVKDIRFFIYEQPAFEYKHLIKCYTERYGASPWEDERM